MAGGCHRSRRSDQWHVTNLVYDTDTLGHFLDGVPVGIHGFGDGGDIALADAGSLTIRGSTGAFAFKGQLADVRVDSGIPVELEALLDQKRVTAQWYITTKLENLRPTKNLGNPSGSATYSTSTNTYYGKIRVGNPSGTLTMRWAAGRQSPVREGVMIVASTEVTVATAAVEVISATLVTNWVAVMVAADTVCVLLAVLVA
jgi:hypothetical protein